MRGIPWISCYLNTMGGILGASLDVPCYLGIHGYFAKGRSSMGGIHGAFLDVPCYLGIHGYSAKGEV